MSWLTRYRFQLYLRNSIWIFPVLSIGLALIAVAVLTRIDRAFGLKMEINPETARTVIGMVAASMFTLVVIGSSAVLLAVQLSSAQLTPRIIVFIYRNRIRKFLLALFVFTFTFSVAVLVRIEGSVPLLTTYLAAYGFLLNLALFIYFCDAIGKTLRPGSALRSVALAAREVNRSVYPQPLSPYDPLTPPPEIERNNLTRVVLNAKDGVLLAVDVKGLVAMAEDADCLIEVIPEVGNLVAAGEPLFRIFEGGQRLSEEVLQSSIAVGHERTLENDPMFAFRIIVDIATKALSPAVNDPTTAVLAIDQLHHLLRDIGSRSLDNGGDKDNQGQVRVIHRTPDWEEFVQLAVVEIRHYGGDSIQVVRRLRAMLENLVETLPERRALVLRNELKLLSSSAKRRFAEPDDQDLALKGDLQGIGGGHNHATPFGQSQLHQRLQKLI
jgi:uncharacterized membrane protein